MNLCKLRTPSLILLFSTLFAFTACDSEDETSTSQESTSTSEPSGNNDPSSDPDDIGDEFKCGDDDEPTILVCHIDDDEDEGEVVEEDLEDLEDHDDHDDDYLLRCDSGLEDGDDCDVQ